MAKQKLKNKKKKKKNVADSLIKKKAAAAALSEKVNPFEVHINKKKYDVIGQKSKHDHGLPGVARAKAIKKRKKTLLVEYQQRNKDSKIIDHRIGEQSFTLSSDDKMVARFAAERMKSHNKKTRFNLAEGEMLTHRGQSLNEIERFDDPRSDDEEEETKLGAEFVKEAHFGGFLTRKKTPDEEEENEGDKASRRSRKDVIEELIAESKRKKAEMQRNKDETLDLTDKLDKDWKGLVQIVAISKRKKEEEEEVKTKADAYDIAVRTLKFEARGTPTDRLKTEEEIAQEEKERLEQLESDRIRRMKGIVTEDTTKSKHRSADDLDDGFAVESDDEKTIGYDDGKMVKLSKKQKKKELKERLKEPHKEKFEIDNEDAAQGDIAEEEEEETKEKENDSAEEEEEEEENESDDGENDDSYSDLETDEDENDEKQVKGGTLSNKSSDIKVKLQALKADMEKAREEIPYTFSVPENYEGLHDLLHKYPAVDQGIVLQRMIKCNHPKLSDQNQEKLKNLFAFLMQYVYDKAVDFGETEVGSEFDRGSTGACVIQTLVPYLYDIAQISPDNAAHCLRDVIKEKHDDFIQSKSKTYPGFETLVFLQLSGLLFPTSDFRHPVITPTITFMCLLLSQCRVKDRRSVAAGLFLTTLILEFTHHSKRFCPEAINFLTGVVFLSVSNSAKRAINVSPPFQSNRIESELLYVQEESLEKSAGKLDLRELVSSKDVDAIFSYTSLSTALSLCAEFIDLLRDLPSAPQIFSPLRQILPLIPQSVNANELKEQIDALTIKIDDLQTKKLQPLMKPKEKPKALRQYEPVFEEYFTGQRKRYGSEKKLEREKMLHKYKKEMKGAVREIRRDSSFLAKVQIEEQIKRDDERKRKVKELLSSLADQEGDYKKIKKLKR